MTNSITDRAGWVYFIHAKETDRVKIGRSINPIHRQSELQKQSPFRLELWECFYSIDCKTDELKLHERFAQKRVNGEWFEIYEELYIREKVLDEFNSHELVHPYWEWCWTYQQIYDDAVDCLSQVNIKEELQLLRVLDNFLQDTYGGNLNFFYFTVKTNLVETLKTISSFTDPVIDPTSYAIGFIRSALCFLDSKQKNLTYQPYSVKRRLESLKQQK